MEDHNTRYLWLKYATERKQTAALDEFDGNVNHWRQCDWMSFMALEIALKFHKLWRLLLQQSLCILDNNASFADEECMIMTMARWKHVHQLRHHSHHNESEGNWKEERKQATMWRWKERVFNKQSTAKAEAITLQNFTLHMATDTFYDICGL